MEEKGFNPRKWQIADTRWTEKNGQKHYGSKECLARCAKRFAEQPLRNEQEGIFIRVIGVARAKTKIGLKNLVYNIRRCVTLCRMNRSAA